MCLMQRDGRQGPGTVHRAQANGTMSWKRGESAEWECFDCQGVRLLRGRGSEESHDKFQPKVKLAREMDTYNLSVSAATTDRAVYQLIRDDREQAGVTGVITPRVAQDRLPRTHPQLLWYKLGGCSRTSGGLVALTSQDEVFVGVSLASFCHVFLGKGKESPTPLCCSIQ